ncbi:MAG: alpha/beta hydrolase [Chloroflexi bacterium]|nr:alpha/beta hydrolase [Chloroflexota bacterium]
MKNKNTKTKAFLILILTLLLTGVACASGGNAKAQRVSFTTEDGITLKGRIFGMGNIGIVLSHMYPKDQKSWFAFAQVLADNGYMALTFDFRGYGESGGKKDIALIDRDVKAALDFIESWGTEKVFLMGASMGGTASLKVAAKEKEEVAGIITISAPVEFMGLSALNDIPLVKEPKLFIASRKDSPAFQGARQLYDLSSEPRHLMVFEGASHGTDIFSGEEEKNVELAILDFLSRNK